MSREIKFRAWDKETKQYFKVLAIDFKSKIVSCRHFKWKYDLFNQINLIDLDLEQFTGLKDANGKEIYEGDIVKSSYKYAQPKISQVIVECGNSYILGEDLATGNEMLVSDHINEIEVIGNVHTKHELLEADE